MTAAPFSTYGAYNGFPYCTAKIDVSGYDFWTTLSGYNEAGSSTAVTAAQIESSLQKAAQLYWNLWKLVYEYDDPDDATYGTFYETVWMDTTTEPPTVATDEHPPSNRVCGSSSDRALETWNEFVVLTYSDFAVARLYNGVTTDEDNFVGYGFNGDCVTSVTQSYTNELVINSYEDDDADTSILVDYTDLDGYHFVCRATNAGVANGAGNTTSAVDAYVEYNSGSNLYRIDFKYSSQFFNFYTYP
jgi:hypothetical protein